VSLHDALDRGATILTANLRAARALEAAYAEDQRGRGIAAWPRPRVRDWNSWVAELWEQHARQASDAPMLLSSLQEHQLWTRVQGPDRDRVVAPERMAELAQQAYDLLGNYRAHRLRPAAADGLFADTHEDAERFLAWANGFDRLCRQHGWVSRSRLEELLSDDAARLPAVPELCLVGFDRTTPAQAALLNALRQAGTLVAEPQLSPNLDSTMANAGKPLLLRATDQRAELEACAHWCRTRLAEDGACRIGVIAPDLGRVRADLDRVFRRILMPQTTLLPSSPGAPPEPELPYEFSLGISLSSLPIVRAALLLLRWLTSPLPAAELTWLLTSGFFAESASDQLAMARLDADLRRTSGAPEVSFAALLGHPRRLLPASARTRLIRIQSRAASERLGAPRQASTGRRASHAFWAELAPSLLTEAGWPGYREADSFTFQTQQRFTRLLGELAELGFDDSQLTWNEFRRTLEAHAHAVIFAAESTLAPVQILGAFESSGQSFDALWFLGADDGHWPATGRLHPLLPAWLQRESGMPHAEPDADWLLAQRATARIVRSAPVVVLSYPATDQGQGQGMALRPSPLLLEHAAAQPAHPPAAPSLAAPRLQRVDLENVADDSGQLSWPAEQSAGGADALKRQAACAFQSFATHRLAARPLEQAAAGLDAAERGIALHSVLERLWTREEQPGSQRLHSRDDLRRALADGSLPALLTHHLDQVFSAMRAEQPENAWQQAYLACEQQRVEERLRTWLAIEAQRQPFTVEALEQEVEAMLVGTLRLKVRLDRVDRLADGTALLIDYKTGMVETTAWMGERPEEPQLPLYAVFSGIEDVSGVAFARIRAGQTRLLARAADPSAMVSEALGTATEKNRFDDEIRDGWRAALLALANQFARGEAAVNPRDGEKTCSYCPLTGLCRVHATNALVQMDRDEASEQETEEEEEIESSLGTASVGEVGLGEVGLGEISLGEVGLGEIDG
jgi:probable DNA repair protein